jgi:hypothetical protein
VSFSVDDNEVWTESGNFSSDLTANLLISTRIAERIKLIINVSMGSSTDWVVGIIFNLTRTKITLRGRAQCIDQDRPICAISHHIGSTGEAVFLSCVSQDLCGL